MTKNESIIIGVICSGYEDVLSMLEEKDFTTTLGKKVFKIAKELKSSNKDANLISIANNSDLSIEKLQPYVEEIISPSMRFSAIDGIKNERALREAKDFKPEDYKPEELPIKLIEKAREIQNFLNFNCESICDIVEELKRQVPRIKTGFNRLDSVLGGGIEHGAVMMVGGIPGDGKTSFATHVTSNTLEADKHVHFVSLEMTRASLVRRVMKAYWDKTEKEVMESIDDAINMSGRLTVTNTLTRLPDVLNSIAKNSDADLIVVDYIQRIRDDNHRNNRVTEAESVSNSLANIAQEYQVPMLCLSQLSRDYKQDKKAEPQMYHLKNSGANEADAHVVALLHNPIPDKPKAMLVDDEPNEFEFDDERIMFIRKNRNGSIGDIKFVFDKKKSRFNEIDFYKS